MEELLRLLATFLIGTILVETGQFVLWIVTAGWLPSRLEFYPSKHPLRLALWTGLCVWLGLIFWLFVATIIFH
jgi:hypothetical protein